jgi:hypothetical protein
MIDGDPVSRLDVIHARADARHDAGRLVAWDDAGESTVGFACLAHLIEAVEFASAKPGRFHLNDGLTGSGFRIRKLRMNHFTIPWE